MQGPVLTLKYIRIECPVTIMPEVLPKVVGKGRFPFFTVTLGGILTGLTSYLAVRGLTLLEQKIVERLATKVRKIQVDNLSKDELLTSSKLINQRIEELPDDRSDDDGKSGTR